MNHVLTMRRDEMRIKRLLRRSANEQQQRRRAGLHTAMSDAFLLGWLNFLHEGVDPTAVMPGTLTTLALKGYHLCPVYRDEVVAAGDYHGNN